MTDKTPAHQQLVSGVHQQPSSGSPLADPDEFTNDQKLSAMEQALNEAEGLNQQIPVQQSFGRQKEQYEGVVNSQELPGGMWHAETEPSPEIPPELESYIQHAEEARQHQAERQLQDITDLAAQEHITSSPKSMKVLPITKEQEDAGQKKSTKFSLRWLVEFSEKIKKIFAGTVVYRQEEGPPSNQV